MFLQTSVPWVPLLSGEVTTNPTAIPALTGTAAARGTNAFWAGSQRRGPLRTPKSRDTPRFLPDSVLKAEPIRKPILNPSPSFLASAGLGRGAAGAPLCAGAGASGCTTELCARPSWRSTCPSWLYPLGYTLFKTLPSPTRPAKWPLGLLFAPAPSPWCLWQRSTVSISCAFSRCLFLLELPFSRGVPEESVFSGKPPRSRRTYRSYALFLRPLYSFQRCHRLSANRPSSGGAASLRLSDLPGQDKAFAAPRVCGNRTAPVRASQNTLRHKTVGKDGAPHRCGFCFNRRCLGREEGEAG